MTTWLDTETKALLQQDPPQRLAPADTAAFTLVLLAIFNTSHQGLVGAVQHVMLGSAVAALNLVARPMPVVVKKGLSYPEAQLGQLQLIFVDAISVFVRDEVAAEAPPEYLADLYARVRQSEEFEWVSVSIDSLPDSPHGREFCVRMLGREVDRWPTSLKLMRKKALAMKFLGERLGGRVTIERYPPDTRAG